jgi:hypothetical protein
MRTDNPEAGPPARTGEKTRIGGGLHAALRIGISMQAVAILGQAVTAGQFLDGSSGLKGVHGAGAGIVHLLAVIQVILAVLWWRPARGRDWPAVVSLLLMLAGFAQSAVGGSGNLAVHVPLGVGMFGLAIVLTGWAWLPGSSVRPARHA